MYVWKSMFPNVVARIKAFNADIPDILYNGMLKIQYHNLSLIEIHFRGYSRKPKSFIDNPAFATAIWGGPQHKIDLMVVYNTEAPSGPCYSTCYQYNRYWN
jgi:hypothetical protein